MHNDSNGTAQTKQPTTSARVLLRPEEMFERYGFPIQTLANWRLKGEGPPYLKVGARSVFYRIDDVDRWLASKVTTSTSRAVRS